MHAAGTLQMADITTPLALEYLTGNVYLFLPSPLLGEIPFSSTTLKRGRKLFLNSFQVDLYIFSLSCSKILISSFLLPVIRNTLQFTKQINQSINQCWFLLSKRMLSKGSLIHFHPKSIEFTFQAPCLHYIRLTSLLLKINRGLSHPQQIL